MHNKVTDESHYYGNQNMLWKSQNTIPHRPGRIPTGDRDDDNDDDDGVFVSLYSSFMHI